MHSTESILPQSSGFAIPGQDLVTPQSCVPLPVVVKTTSDRLNISRCMQLIWNEVDRLTVLGVIRSEEDKWFFAYRKAVCILEGDD